MSDQHDLSLGINHIDVESGTVLEVGWVSENAINKPRYVGQLDPGARSEVERCGTAMYEFPVDKPRILHGTVVCASDVIRTSIVTRSSTQSSQVPCVEYSNTDLSDLVLRIFESLAIQAHEHNVQIVCW